MAGETDWEFKRHSTTLPLSGWFWSGPYGTASTLITEMSYLTDPGLLAPALGFGREYSTDASMIARSCTRAELAASSCFTCRHTDRVTHTFANVSKCLWKCVKMRWNAPKCTEIRKLASWNAQCVLQCVGRQTSDRKGFNSLQQNDQRCWRRQIGPNFPSCTGEYRLVKKWMTKLNLNAWFIIFILFIYSYIHVR